MALVLGKCVLHRDNFLLFTVDLTNSFISLFYCIVGKLLDGETFHFYLIQITFQRIILFDHLAIFLIYDFVSTNCTYLTESAMVYFMTVFMSHLAKPTHLIAHTLAMNPESSISKSNVLM